MNVLFSFKQVQTFLTILVMMIFSFSDASADTSSLLIKIWVKDIAWYI